MTRQKLTRNCLSSRMPISNWARSSYFCLPDSTGSSTISASSGSELTGEATGCWLSTAGVHLLPMAVLIISYILLLSSVGLSGCNPTRTNMRRLSNMENVYNSCIVKTNNTSNQKQKYKEPAQSAKKKNIENHSAVMNSITHREAT
jgi:hypothetical protein